MVVVGIACIPWLVRKLQQHGAFPQRQGGHASVLSACPVGPQQQVVTVKVAYGQCSAVLVLGVTPSSVQCLHRWEAPADPGAAVGPPASTAAEGPLPKGVL